MDKFSDQKRLKNDLRNASPEERRALWASYGEWIKAGAKAQGPWAWGVALFGVSMFVSLLVAACGVGSIAIYVACGLGAAVGFFIARIAFRRERDWRRAHPFYEWRGRPTFQ